MKKGFIKCYDDLIDEETCSRLIDMFYSNPERAGIGRMTAGVSKLKKVMEIELADFIDDPETARLYRRLNTSFRRALEEYVKDVPSIGSTVSYGIEDDALKMKRYIKGVGYYETHLDNSTAHPRRVISAVAYLNDVKDGGQTKFPIQDVEVSAVRGRIVLFPSFWTYPHQSVRNESEDKFAVTSFFNAG